MSDQHFQEGKGYAGSLMRELNERREALKNACDALVSAVDEGFRKAAGKGEEADE